MDASVTPTPLRSSFLTFFVACLSLILAACGGGGSGGDSGSGSTSGSQTVHAVDVFETPAGAGTYTGNGEYADGETVSLSATANDGYVFEGWMDSGDVISTDPTYQFSADRPYVLEARFRLAPTVSRVTVPSDGIVTLFEATHARSGVMYAATKEATIGDGKAGIWQSLDYGATWEKLLPGKVSFITIASADSDLVIVGMSDPGRVQISTDGGSSWFTRQIQEGLYGGYINFLDASSVTAGSGIYLVTDNFTNPGLYKTVDLGESWSRPLTESDTGSLSDAQLASVEVSPQNSDVLYTATRFSTNIWTSRNQGVDFTSILNGLSTDSFLFTYGIAINPTSPDEVFVNNNITVNGGANWSQVTNLSPDRAFWFEGNLIRFNSEAFDGFLEVSTDYGATWTQLMALIDDSDNSFWGIADVFVAQDALYFEQETGSSVSAQIFRISLETIRSRLNSL